MKLRYVFICALALCLGSIATAHADSVTLDLPLPGAAWLLGCTLFGLSALRGRRPARLVLVPC